MRLRPDIRLPWQALTLFAATIYLVRSALRGWDFRPSVLDALVFGALAVILLLRPLMAKLLKDDEEDS